ncbi:DNA replication licensing factor Mcm3 [Planococcus citri]|uniref:DNA replication licensing factor Mcm3 n=1 Tax=Planococcus citri TaxID=170843 RepID=UPI0031F8D2BF
MDDTDFDHKAREIQREYLEFLDDEEGEDLYHGKVKSMIDDGRIRITVNVNDLRAKNPKRTIELLKTGFPEQIAFQKALYEYVSSLNTKYASDHEEFFISFEGSFGNRHVTPRTLTSRYLGNMVCLEGIVTKCSMVFPKVVKSVHYCPATGKTMDRRYTDLTSFDAFPSSSVYPTKDDDGNILETEYGLSTYKDHQTLTVQEMPEKSPAGQLPRSVDIVCDNDLVDTCKPGDRVQIVGTYRCLPGKQGSFTSGSFRTVLIANHITLLSSEAGTVQLTKTDVRNCRQLAKNKNMFELLSKSLAPSIHGHEYVKKAILCMLLGGCEKVLPNGTRLRGDINILLIGDPSVAKSQLLRYVLCTAPRAIPTTGRGSSGVGLTAAVTTDSETGERRLEAGAMVLADRGVVCIDEFDKMSDMDRTAIHEVMEQGRVTISKAGIHARLNARCSVLAAANPVYGKYNPYEPPMKNIGLQDSLLSRFDLLFVMLDQVDKETDERISDHVVRMHRFRKAGEQDGAVLSFGNAVDMLSTQNVEELTLEEQTAPIYEKYDALLHGSTRSRSDKYLTVQFMKKYISFSIKFLKPKLTVDASEKIAEAYTRLRSEDDRPNDTARTQPVTVRTLETLIRLATAHAKARLSRSIDAEDAEAAIELVDYAYFKKVEPKPQKKKRRNDDSEVQEGSIAGTDDEEDVHAVITADTNGDEGGRPRKRNRTDRDVYDFDEGSAGTDSRSMELEMSAGGSQRQAPDEITLPPPTSISTDRLQRFQDLLSTLFDREKAAVLSIGKVIEQINSNLAAHEKAYEGGELAAAIERLTTMNKVLLTGGTLFKV